MPRLAARELGAVLLGLWRSPRFALPALLSLALSVGGATAVFSVFSGLMLRPLPFADEERLVQLGVHADGSGEAPVISAPFTASLRDLDVLFESFALYRGYSGHIGAQGTGQPAQHVQLELTTPEFFDTLGIQAEAGRTFTARGPAPDAEDVVVLRRGAWLAQFGGQPMVGKTILLNGEPKLVLGIIGDEQAFPYWGDMWLPSRERMKDGSPLTFLLSGAARLRPGVSLDSLRDRLRQNGESLQVRLPTGALVTATARPLREGLVGDRRGRSAALMLTAVAAFALLACANLAALLGTRASVRQHELAVRSALGASRGTLARQNALEAAVLVLVGGALGLAIAAHFTALWARDYRELLGNTPPRLDTRAALACAGLLLLTAAVGTLAPALQVGRVRPMDALRGEGRSSQGRRARRVRESLVAIQVALTLALLIPAGLLVRSVRALIAVDTGFHAPGVVTATLEVPTKRLEPGVEDVARRQDAQQRLLPLFERLGGMLGVRGLCMASELPFDNNSAGSMVELETTPSARIERALTHWISPGCFETLGVPLLSGRDFKPDEPRARFAIVNRRFARDLIGVDDAVGHRFRVASAPQHEDSTPEPWIDIVGMVGDAMEYDLTEPAPPAAYFPFLADPRQMGGEGNVFLSVAVRGSDDPSLLLGALPRAVSALSPDAAVFDVKPLGDWVERSFRDRAALERLLSVFGLAAMALAAVGLFGVTAYAVAERAPEIGIRRALGASRRQILTMILREMGLVLAVGVVAGLGLSWLARSLIQSFLFGVASDDPWTIVGVCLSTVTVGLLAALAPAQAAARVAPSRALAGR